MIERSFDYRKIQKMAPWQPVISSKIIYLIDEKYGLWILHKYLNGLEFHVEMNTRCRGKEAIKQGRKALKWVFDNTDISVIYANVSKVQKHVCYYARQLGMKFIYEKNIIRSYKIVELDL